MDGRTSLMPIDWAKAAWLKANGARPGEIAAAVGCSRSQLRRRQQSCCLFSALVDQYRSALAGVDALAEAKPGQPPNAAGWALAETVREKLEQEIIDGNVKVALWLAERLRLFSPQDKGGTDTTLRRLLETMSDAERQAFERPD